MLRLARLSLVDFKNYGSSSFDFTKNIVGISGRNGIGKTNLLDAIYYTCFTKSYFTPPDHLNIRFNESGFRIEADFEKSGRAEKLVCINRASNKKEFSLNAAPYEKLSEHIGCFPAVIIAPDDIEIITGGSELRRKYLDAVICQLDPEYLRRLITYNKLLLQRNSLLKQFAGAKTQDFELLDVITGQMIGPAEYVFTKRSSHGKILLDIAADLYREIADDAESADLSYRSQAQSDNIINLLKLHLQRDLFMQRTTAGIHRDDLAFNIADRPFKTIASQGQRKSLLFALKLAQFELLKMHNDFPPLLLLDDVFEKLDARRMERLLVKVCAGDAGGQVFITDTHSDRLTEAFKNLKIDGQLIELTLPAT